MAYGTPGAKAQCTYLMDDGETAIEVFHTADVIAAGSFGAAGAGSMKPSRGVFIERHVGLLGPAKQRAKCAIGTPAVLAALNVGGTFPYGGLTFTITSLTGEKLRRRP